MVRAPDGTIWKVATSAKKDTGPATRRVDEIVLLLGVPDVAATKRFSVDQGLAVVKSFGRMCVEFAAGSSPVELALYRRRALAEDVGVPPEGTGSHRLVIGGASGLFTDPDGSPGRPRRRCPRPDASRRPALPSPDHYSRAWSVRAPPRPGGPAAYASGGATAWASAPSPTHRPMKSAAVASSSPARSRPPAATG